MRTNEQRTSGRISRLILLLLAVVALALGTAQAGGGHSITSPDTAGDVGGSSSLVLDSNGYPVVSYSDGTNGDLKLLHCNDANCSGSDESITSPDTTGSVGFFASLVLDESGNPVVSYYDTTNGDLKLLHCNDPNCSGGDESITSPDTAGDVGWNISSLALDASGYPVVSYRDQTNGDLKLLHCNDPNCSGGDESITAPDTAGDVGLNSALALDSNAYPVISYWDQLNGDLKLLHCNDPNCAGSDESITAPDTAGDVGRSSSLVLDPDGYPIVSYYDSTNGDLKLLHCSDPNCNTPPIAEAGGPYGGAQGFAIPLRGAGASDVDIGPLTYSWEVDSIDCTFSDNTILNPSLTCGSTGAFTATLTVDDGQDTDSDSATVNVIAPERIYIPIMLRPADD